MRQRESNVKRHTKSDTSFQPEENVFLKNLKRNDRKRGWSLMPLIGPFIIETISDKNTCILKSDDRILKKNKQHLKNFKNFKERTEQRLEVNGGIEDQILSISDRPKCSKIKYFRLISKSWMNIKCSHLKINLKSEVSMCNLGSKNIQKL